MSSSIIVVGAGGCGLVAALAAARQGASVVVLEKTDRTGGGTALSSKGIRAAGSRFQRAKGIDDDGAAYARDILNRNRGRSDLALTERLTQESGRLAEWLAESAGIEFEIGSRLFGHTRPRSHTWRDNRTITDYLTAAVEREEKLHVLFSTRARSLKVDAGGAVTGVVTDAGVQQARKVILATGGYGASPELLSLYIPRAVDIPSPGHPGSTGDGLRMGLEIGAAAGNLDAFQPFPTYVAPLNCEVPPDVVNFGAILVDKNGRRFANESAYPGGVGAKMLDLPDKQAYEIFDERVFRLNQSGLSKAVAGGMVEKAETVSKLAAKLGIDPRGLEETIRDFNSTAGDRDAFGRTIPAPVERPLYGINVWVALFHTQGGLKVNTNAQVLRPDGTVIPNLYAGGGAAIGVSGPGPEGYLPGNGLLASLGLGKIAGEHAAASLKAAR